MFSFKQCGPERGDCMAPYDVILDKEYTIKEFVDAVLKRNKEWGYIGIYNKDSVFSDRLFGKPRCEYRYGELLSNLPGDILNKKVLSVSGNGGWTRMDYILKIEE